MNIHLQSVSSIQCSLTWSDSFLARWRGWQPLSSCWRTGDNVKNKIPILVVIATHASPRSRDRRPVHSWRLGGPYPRALGRRAGDRTVLRPVVPVITAFHTGQCIFFTRTRTSERKLWANFTRESHIVSAIDPFYLTWRFLTGNNLVIRGRWTSWDRSRQRLICGLCK